MGFKNNECTSSVMMREGRRPSCSGGMSEPLRDDGPLPGAKDPLRLGTGDFSFDTSSFGGSTSLGAPGAAYFYPVIQQINFHFVHFHTLKLPNTVCFPV